MGEEVAQVGASRKAIVTGRMARQSDSRKKSQTALSLDRTPKAPDGRSTFTAMERWCTMHIRYSEGKLTGSPTTSRRRFCLPSTLAHQPLAPDIRRCEPRCHRGVAIWWAAGGSDAGGFQVTARFVGSCRGQTGSPRFIGVSPMWPSQGTQTILTNGQPAPMPTRSYLLDTPNP